MNDLVKLAAHRCGRPYMSFGTAASMDGYTAFGASITHEGSKQTFDCPAPRAFVGDTKVIARAPVGMAATGYADLLAKIPAGADWILADALGVEPINDRAWQVVQSPLRNWLADPIAVARAEPGAIERLLQGLLASGLAMQVTKDSRPASGAEHQFSHLWDMENHRHNGEPVPHGSKVAIGTLASCWLYEALLKMPLDQLDIDACAAKRSSLEQVRQTILQMHSLPALQKKAILESTAKYVQEDVFRSRLERLRACWPMLRERLKTQLLPLTQIREMLGRVGAPTDPDQIGITRERLRRSFLLAQTIRRRYTILDLAADIGQLESLAVLA